jgi:hypothetical protein
MGKGKLIEPWNQKPGIQNKLEIDDGQPFFEFDEDAIIFDEENPENDMVEDYKTARKNALYCIDASKAMLNQITLYLRYDANPLVADACVKLVKTISENNRDLLKIHEDFRKNKIIGKPKPKDIPDDPEDTEDEQETKLTATVTEIVAKHEQLKAEKDES